VEGKKAIKKRKKKETLVDGLELETEKG